MTLSILFIRQSQVKYTQFFHSHPLILPNLIPVQLSFHTGGAGKGFLRRLWAQWSKKQKSCPNKQRPPTMGQTPRDRKQKRSNPLQETCPIWVNKIRLQPERMSCFRWLKWLNGMMWLREWNLQSVTPPPWRCQIHECPTPGSGDLTTAYGSSNFCFFPPTSQPLSHKHQRGNGSIRQSHVSGWWPGFQRLCWGIFSAGCWSKNSQACSSVHWTNLKLTGFAMSFFLVNCWEQSKNWPSFCNCKGAGSWKFIRVLHARGTSYQGNFESGMAVRTIKLWLQNPSETFFIRTSHACLAPPL